MIERLSLRTAALAECGGCDVTMSVCFLGTYSTEHMLVFFFMTHGCAPIYVMGPWGGRWPVLRKVIDSYLGRRFYLAVGRHCVRFGFVSVDCGFTSTDHPRFRGLLAVEQVYTISRSAAGLR